MKRQPVIRMKPKSVQIPYELFLNLLQYHLTGEHSSERSEAIQSGLSAKLDSLIRHNLYTAYKTAPTASEQEKARQAYLQEIGMNPDFIWEPGGTV